MIEGDTELDDEMSVLQESDLFELMEPIGSQWRSGNGILRNENNSDPFIQPIIIAVSALIGVPILLATMAPEELPMFPPQGLPQPGSVTEGGGEQPFSEIIVRH